MSFEQVWYRFEAKRKDGSVWKLRIQDLPPARVNDVLDTVVNFFMRDEPLHRAVGLATSPASIEMYRKVLAQDMRDPSFRTVICCSDDTPDVKNLIGLSMMMLVTDSTTSTAPQLPATVKNEGVPQEHKKFHEICIELRTLYNPLKELNLNVYYKDRGLFVYPDYRGMGISEKFGIVRRLMCKALGVSMTGAWVTAFGTQIAAARDGWETVKEIEFDYLAKKFDVTFTEAPRTIKFMIARVDNTEDQRK